MRINKRSQLSACLAVMLSIPQLGLAQDAPDFSIDFDEVVAIIGGEESQLGNFPSTTALLRVSPTQSLFQRQFCAGTAISDSYILTAAHCMFGAFGEIDPDEILIAGNFIDLVNDSPAEIPVEQIFVHEAYDDEALLAEHDIAILRTSVPHNIPPISLFSGNARTLTGVAASIAGWGVVQLPQFPGDSSRFPTVLNEAKVPVTDFNTCNDVYQRQLSAPHVCAGFQQGGIDACQGDSGGPLMINDGGTLIQIGITSFGNSCALPDAYGVYSNIEQYESFISRIVPPPSNGNPLFAKPEQIALATLTEDDDSDDSFFGIGSVNHGLLFILAMGAAMRAGRSRRSVGRVAGVATAALLTTGCALNLAPQNDEYSTGSAGSVVVSEKSSSNGLTKVSNKSVESTSLVKTSSDHKNLPMFDIAALSEKREGAIEAATVHYGAEPVCEGKKVAPKDSKRADFYEHCVFAGMSKPFEGGTIESVAYHFMSNRIVQIDATLHGPAFVLSSMADTLDEILGESVFSLGESEASAEEDALPQAVYHWSDPEIAFARLMTEAGADTESFLFTLQHSRFSDIIAELPAL